MSGPGLVVSGADNVAVLLAHPGYVLQHQLDHSVVHLPGLLVALVHRVLVAPLPGQLPLLLHVGAPDDLGSEAPAESLHHGEL